MNTITRTRLPRAAADCFGICGRYTPDRHYLSHFVSLGARMNASADTDVLS